MNDTIKKGDMVLFFAGDTWLSKSISYLTGGEVTHAAMMYAEDSIIEILSDGVQVNQVAVWHEEGKGKKAYVMRHRKGLAYEPLKKSADAYLAADISYDFPGLYLLGALLIYNKFVPTARFLKSTELILELAVRQLDHFIQKQIRHNPGKAMVCSQFIYQLFYDCGGAYRIPIVDGCFSVNNKTDGCSQKEICLAQLGETFVDAAADERRSGRKEAVLDDCSVTVTEQSIEMAAKELYLSLTDIECGMEGDELCSSPANMDKASFLAGQFLNRVKELREKLGADYPLDAMFVTVADLASHAPDLERVDTVYIERI